MKDTVLHQRVVKTACKGKKGKLVITAKLHQLGSQAPYFSITTGSGADHANILQARPDLSWFVELHLANQDGMPMHAVANGVYHLKQKHLEFDVIARHFRIPESEAQGIWADFKFAVMDAHYAAETEVKKAFLSWDALAKAMPEWLLSRDSKVIAPRNSKGLTSVHEAITAWLDSQSDNAVTTELRAAYKACCQGQIPLPDLVRRLQNGSETGAEFLRKMREFFSNGYQKFAVGKGRMIELAAKEIETKYVSDLIEACFASCWKRQADKAIAWLQESDESDSLTTEASDFGPDAFLVVADGDTVEVEEIRDGSYLPEVDLGGESYYVAEDQAHAADATEKYWADMVKHDPEEFKCMVGEDTLVAWALGKSAGPGTTKVSSLDEWITLTGERPHEQWAGYDGNAGTLKVNKLLYKELFGKEARADAEFIEVLAYRNN